ncbi:hypothetical protein K461DRAFT_298385 [Myriangium duriaei CBS 260.36]|uniref:Uncharacterized protein n=1 Tax=Myriangium duriaei CBS 260.36 TaxID=1168546 RepID=A0A9P4IVR8_9PEZI|nr:hypothetical protein K461DRAFT_298385 [Myriangium duriaei CBS 260.36]
MFSYGSSFFAERPIVFFDSHPEPPAGIVWDSINSVKKQLIISWTGDVVLDVQPGLVRLQWYTTDGKFGKKDYELREHEDVRQGFEKLCTLDDVSRCQVLGYPSQNPFSIFGESEFAIQERKKREILDSAQYRDFIPRNKKGPSVAEQIDDIIDFEEKKQEGKKQQFVVGEEEV